MFHHWGTVIFTGDTMHSSVKTLPAKEPDSELSTVEHQGK